MSDGSQTDEMPCPLCLIGGAARVPLENLHWLECHIPRTDDLLREVAASSGQSLNASATGRRLGLSCHAVSHRIAALEKAGMIRILPSLASRHFHVLLRDCRLLRKLGGIRRALFQTCLTEHITAVYTSWAPSTRYFQWEAGRVKRIDLVVRTGWETVGFCFKECLVPRNRDWAPLRLGLESGVIDRGFIIHRGTGAFVTARVVIALSVRNFLGQLDKWLSCRSFPEARRLLRSLAASQVLRESRSVPDVGKLGSTSVSSRGLAGETDAQPDE